VLVSTSYRPTGPFPDSKQVANAESSAMSIDQDAVDALKMTPNSIIKL
jgi:hypothetical protein